MFLPFSYFPIGIHTYFTEGKQLLLLTNIITLLLLLDFISTISFFIFIQAKQELRSNLIALFLFSSLTHLICRDLLNFRQSLVLQLSLFFKK
jgi:hypothetical protein